MPGSGTAIPTSILTTSYEVNGLVINNRDDLEHYWIDEIDGLYDAEVRDSREVNTDADGEVFLGGLYAGKPLSISGKIRAQTYEKMLDMQMALSEAFGEINVEYPFIGRTNDINRDWVVHVVKTAAIAMKDVQDTNQYRRNFLIQLRASKPGIFSLWEKQAHQLLSDGNNITVDHLGNKKAFPRILLFGRQTDVAVSNNTTGQQFRLKEGWTIPAGRYYEIDFENGEIIDDLGVNRFDSFDHTSDWLQLERSASQVLTIISTNRDASAAATVYWRDTYR